MPCRAPPHVTPPPIAPGGTGPAATRLHDLSKKSLGTAGALATPRSPPVLPASSRSLAHLPTLVPPEPMVPTQRSRARNVRSRPMAPRSRYPPLARHDITPTPRLPRHTARRVRWRGPQAHVHAVGVGAPAVSMPTTRPASIPNISPPAGSTIGLVTVNQIALMATNAQQCRATRAPPSCGSTLPSAPRPIAVNTPAPSGRTPA